MRLSSLADYAIVLMCAAAKHYSEEGGGDSQRYSARQLSDETGLPLPTTQKLVSLLAKAELIMSTRGAGGGIILSRKPSDISLTDIVEAIEGPIMLTNCACDEVANMNCALIDQCRIRSYWPGINQSVRDHLASVRVSDLLKNDNRENISPEAA